ncbi:MAG: DUF192 domain-containing protein [Actinomycetota bacterium]
MTRPALTLIATLFLAGCGGSAAPVEGIPAGTLSIDTGQEDIQLEVSIAETDDSRQRGLMGVEDLADEAGMVFLEPQPVQSGFWMKDTLIPLSIAFWDESGEVLAVLDMEPCQEEVCEIYDPGVTWIGAVEVNQGFFADNGVDVGDRVTLER